MIGLNKLKKQIVEWILYFAQYLDDEEEVQGGSELILFG